MKVFFSIIPIFLILSLSQSQAQDNTQIETDTIVTMEATPDSLMYLNRDSVLITDTPLRDTVSFESDSIDVAVADIPELSPDTVLPVTMIPQEKTKFVPNPNRAVLYSAIFPGLGQIYNRKYWKLPIVYGGFLGCMYAISWNNTQYQGYMRAYKDYMTDYNNGTIGQNLQNREYYNYLPFRSDGQEWTESEITSYSANWRRNKDYFRRYRDLSIIIAVGVYAICMLDAYVDAQLFEFDISPDIGLRVEPVLFERTALNISRTFGLQCSFKF